ncbi:MAG: M24 family metallopeptidase [Acutalibacteraceae bacterium]
MSINGKLKKLLGDNTGIIISSPENRRYFTRFPSSDGFLLVTSDDAVFFTDSRYVEAAKKTVSACPIEELTNAVKQLPAYFRERGVKRILFERDRLFISDFNKLKGYFEGFECVIDGSLDECITALRVVKTKREIDLIKKAQKIAEAAFLHILEFIRVGVTEKEIALELDFYMLRNGAEALSFETIAVSGENSSLPHGVPSDKKVQRGDFITMDFGAVYGGYRSDMTRTVILKEPSEEQLLVYETVLSAQKAALCSLKPGVSGMGADKAARDIINNAGYGARFGHGTGHGVGLEIHETQALSPRSKDILSPGNVITVEPGIYIPGKFGVRIEDMAVITKDGYENLTNCEKELICL